MSFIRILTPAAATLSLALSLGAPGVAVADDAPTHADTTTQTPQKQSGTKHISQEELDREKVTLKDRAQEQIDAANSNIDELRKMNETKPEVKKKHDDMEKRLSDTRDRLKQDLPKVDDASPSTWGNVRSLIERDLTAMNTQLQRASTVTNVPLPQTGATNKQPQTH
jgi:TolA-binding protein